MRARLLFAMLLAVTIVACRREFKSHIPTPPEGLGPGIVSFTATPKNVSAGEPVTLSWIVRGGNSIVLEEAVDAAIGTDAGRLQEVAKFTESGSLEVRPRQSMVYVLSCGESNSSACMSLSVNVTVSSGH